MPNQMDGNNLWDNGVFDLNQNFDFAHFGWVGGWLAGWMNRWMDRWMDR